MLRIVLACVLLSVTGCAQSSGAGSRTQGEYAEAGIVGGIAVTAAIIQAARGRAKPVGKVEQCCAVCDHCSFPCGDTCIPIGSICYKPQGCACYDSQLPPEHRPPENNNPCGPSPNEDGDAPAVIPMGVSF